MGPDDNEKLKASLQDDSAARQFYAEHSANQYLTFMTFSKDFGQLALRTSVFLNGGSVVALLALLGAAFSLTDPEANRLTPSDFVGAFASYPIGLVLAALAMFVGYLNYLYLAQVHADLGMLANNINKRSPTWPKGDDGKWVNRTYWIAILLGLASYLAFVVASVLVAFALSG